MERPVLLNAGRCIFAWVCKAAEPVRSYLRSDVIPPRHPLAVAVHAHFPAMEMNLRFVSVDATSALLSRHNRRLF